MNHKINIKQFIKDEHEININITKVEVLKIIKLIEEYYINTENNYKEIEDIFKAGTENPAYIVNELLLDQIEIESELRNNILKTIKLPLGS